MKKAIGILLFALVVFAHPTLAWNCANPLAERVVVPAGTVGTFGDGDGQLASFGALLYECKVVPPSTPTGGNSNANSSSNSSASSTSKSGSKSSATGGQSTSNSTAVGGTATGGNSSSGVSASGNSANTNNNTANGGTGGTANATGGSQKQSQSSTSSATNNGNGANNSTYSSVTNVAASKIPVSSAIAPPVIPTASCSKGYSGGGQSLLFGGSFGGTKIDTGCSILEAARLAPNRLARCMVYITNKYVKAAGVTLDQCMVMDDSAPVVQVPTEVSPTPVQTEQTYVLPAPQITINIPAPILSVPVSAPAAPDVAKTAAAQVHHKHPVKPCVTNDTIDRQGPPKNKP